VRIRFTLDITRSPEPDQPVFEHRDVDTLVETTRGGDPAAHRMGFVPSPEYPTEDRVSG